MHKWRTKGPSQKIMNQLLNFYNQGQHSSTVAEAKALLSQYPDKVIIWNIMGAANKDLGRNEEASKAFKKVTELKPGDSEAFNNLGVTLNDQGKLQEALEVYNKAISLKPEYAEAYYNMGLTLQQQGKLEESIVAYNKAVSLKPDYADAYNNVGNAFRDQGQLKEAIEAYKIALSLEPSYAEVHNNIGLILHQQGKLEESIESFKKAILLKYNYADAYNNMGNTLKDKGQSEQAIAAYKTAISLKPGYAVAHNNLSFAFLNIGRLREGLDEYEWRWKNPENKSIRRHFLRPTWDSEKSLKCKRILLWSEQGIGDTINWSSVLSHISSQAEHCILECQEKLVPLLARSFPEVEVKPENRSLDSKRDDFDFHIPLGSLYRQLLTKISQKTKADAYLIPDPVRVNFWRNRLNSLGNGPYVGISWKSSKMTPERMQNYAPILEWSPILRLPDITFINLQYKDFESDLAKVKNELGVKVHNFNDLDHYDNLVDVTAFSAALDIVVSIKNTVSLISAGVGTSTKLANWRQSPWNNILHNPIGRSVDIFERNTWELWDNVFSLIADNIHKQSKTKQSTGVFKNE